MKRILFMMVGFLAIASAGVVFAQTMAADEATVCTMQYAPVCASVQVQCITAPCPPINETFGNACMMNANKLATFLYTGECKTTPLAHTDWKLQSFDSKSATGATLSFDATRVSASVCNSKGADYTIEGNTIKIGPMMSTLMLCMGDLGMYESAFDLSGAKYELSTDGGNHLMITTLANHIFQWQKQNPIGGKPNPASVNCTNNGGTLSILEGKGGQYGMCTFSDGSQCEEWAYYNGQCKPTGQKLQDVMGEYLSVRLFTPEGYSQFINDLRQTINLRLALATGAFKSGYLQVVNFLKSY